MHCPVCQSDGMSSSVRDYLYLKWTKKSPITSVNIALLKAEYFLSASTKTV